MRKNYAAWKVSLRLSIYWLTHDPEDDLYIAVTTNVTTKKQMASYI